MSPTSTSQFLLLPDEVIQIILEHATPQTAISLGLVSKRFRGITEEPLIWRKYCFSTYKFWSPIHEVHLKETVEWKQLFIKRRMINRTVQKALEELISSQTDRSGKFETIVRASYDAKQVLLDNMSSARDHKDVLARRYWAHSALSSVSRDAALSVWSSHYSCPNERTPFDLELLLAAFTLFVRVGHGFGLTDVTNRLDAISRQIRKKHPSIMEFSTRKRALVIAEFLHQHRLLGINSNREYHSLSHSFMSIGLNCKDHSSLPLISAAIFCCICLRFELRATTCSFPYHVHAMVIPEPGKDLDGNPTPKTGDPMYLDPWRSSAEVSVESMREQLSMMPNFDRNTNLDVYLAPSSAIHMTIRCARNISTSIRQFNIRPNTNDIPAHRIHIPSARYAATWATVIFSAPSPASNTETPPPAILRYLHEEVLNLFHIFGSDFPQDGYLMQKHLLPTIQAAFGHQYMNYVRPIQEMRMADATPRRQKLRSNLRPGHVKYKIGQVFKHQRYNYRAVITGWDARCEARDEWIETMGVDGLGDGREQSFYNALVLEDLSTRYVASENITLLIPPETDNFFPEEVAFPAYPLQLGDFALEVGRYFASWDQKEGRFVSAMKDEYPED